MVSWLVILATIAAWIGLLHKARDTRWLPLIATAPLWAPFAVYVIYMLVTE